MARTRHIVIGSALLMCAPTAAWAERPLSGAIEVVWLPVGAVSSDASGERAVNAAHAAYGLAASFDVPVSEHLGFGVGGQNLLGVRAKSAPCTPPSGRSARCFVQDASLEMELLFRLIGWLPIGPRARVFGYAGPGGFAILPPTSAGQSDTPVGVLIAGGVGVRLSLSPRWFLVARLDAHQGFRLAGHPVIPYPYASFYAGLAAGAGLIF